MQGFDRSDEIAVGNMSTQRSFGTAQNGAAKGIFYSLASAPQRLGQSVRMLSRLRLPQPDRYAREEHGSLAVFGLFTFVIVMVLAGIGVDIVRHETLRTELQNTLDRAVLAAANLENTFDPDVVVEDYFAKAGLSQYLSSVKTEVSGQGRRVTATVSADIPTYFMKFAAVDTLTLASHGAAEQGLANLEISLVLDVSNSMNSSNRIGNLALAGKDFAKTIFDNSAPDTVSMSVVPYSTQVNAGPTILSEFNVEDTHDNSYCLNFTESDFETTNIEPKDYAGSKYYQQTVAFDPWYYNDFNKGTLLEVCDPHSYNRILPFSNSLADVQSKIGGLQADGNTSIDVGVKWGAALLDTSAAPLTAALISTGEVSSAMSGRPTANSGSTLKVMVVMTDGVNTTQYYMPSNYRSGNSDIYLAPDGKVSFPISKRKCSYYSCWYETQWYEPQSRNYYSSVYGGSNATQLTWPEVWKRFTVESHAYARYYASGSANDYYFWTGATRVGVSGSTKNARLDKICTAAKNNGVLIFTIGFEAPSDAEDVLISCASSPSHYYDVDGLEIADAFAAIATKVTELRLVE
ncbi:pilus assembly protein TadG-related protein [Celeribacter baekdonensis]|uniref:pilus assembly protein TadG-related protein n=1 Tax=Celeribacter baekdonensis TaxID=875171 RepID=UPI003A90D645